MSAPETLAAGVTLYAGDCLVELGELPEDSVDACVTDPPYHLTSIVKRFGAENSAPTKSRTYARMAAGFMGKQWDGGDVAFDPATWRAVWRVLKPGAHLLAMCGTRNYHRLACAIEDSGFEIRDCVMWLYGSGFPKSHNVALAIDKMNGAAPRSQSFNMKGRGERAEEFDSNGREFLPAYEPITEAARQWDGWGSALKPACELITLARKPLAEDSIAANVLAHGTGALNIEACRVGTEIVGWGGGAAGGNTWNESNCGLAKPGGARPVAGRWPANVVHDGSPEVLAGFPDIATGKGGGAGLGYNGGGSLGPAPERGYGDSGSAARFFYTAKADTDERVGSSHPTVKPVDLIQYLVRLVTPKGGVVLDPFAGTGTTGEAAFREGVRAILIERESEYQADIRRRLALVLAGPDERARELVKARGQVADVRELPLFAEAFDPKVDIRKSVAEGFRVIRERIAAGGPGWDPNEQNQQHANVVRENGE